MEKKQQYQVPQIKQVEFRIERGFQMSGRMAETFDGWQGNGEQGPSEQLTHGWTRSF